MCLDGLSCDPGARQKPRAIPDSAIVRSTSESDVALHVCFPCSHEGLEVGLDLQADLMT